MRAAQDLVCRGLTLSLLVCPALAQASDLLPALAAATRGSTVSGLSSGAFMSVQMHIAHSSRIEGAAILAGGPYYCAEGSPTLALQRCMATTAGKAVTAMIDRLQSPLMAGE